MGSIFSVIKAVLSSKEVIIAAIVLVLYINFMMFVFHYRKKRKVVSKVKAPAVTIPQEQKTDEEEGLISGNVTDIQENE